jgi:hypothetical protein
MPGVTKADQVRHEDLSDALILADDRNVTFLARVRKGPKMMDSPYGWGVEKSNARRTAPVPEGIDVYAFEGDNAKKLYNRKQKFWRTPMVTTEAEELGGLLGASQDYKGQKAKKIREQSFDVETVLLSDQDAKEDQGVKDKGEALMALGRAINDGTSIGASGAALTFGDTQTAIPQDYRTPTAQIYTDYLVASDLVTPTFTEKKLNDMLRSRHDQLGGTAELTLFCGTLLKAHISENFGRFEANKTGFTAITRLSRGDSQTLTKGIDVFEGDNGTVQIEQCSFMPYVTRGYALDMTKVQTRPLFYLRHSMLPYMGAGLEGLIETILGLEFGNPLQHMKIDPLAYSHP